MSSANSRVLPLREVRYRDREGEFSATVQTVLPIHNEPTGSVVFVPGYYAGGDSFAHHVDGVIGETLSTPYGVDIWRFDTRYSPLCRRIGDRVDQMTAVLRHTENRGDGKTVVIPHSEGNHVTLGALMYRPDLLGEIGGVIGLGMVSVNPFSGTKFQEACFADIATPHDGKKPLVNVPLRGLVRVLSEEAVDHLSPAARESYAAGLMSKVSGAAGRLGLYNLISDHAQTPKVPLVPLASAGIGEMIGALPYAVVNPEARRALVTILANVMKLSIGSDPLGEGYQILTTPTAEMSAILSELVPVSHFTGTKDRLAGGSIKDGLISAGFKGDIHEYDMGHLDLLFKRPVIGRVARIAVRYMFNGQPETDVLDLRKTPN